MSALAADRNTSVMGQGGQPVRTSYPVDGGSLIYKGSLVCLNSSGYLVPGATATTLKCVGRAAEHVDNSAGADGDLNCQVEQGVFEWANGNSITLASVGSLAYVVDDQTVSSSATSKSVAGTIYLVDANGVWVYCGLAAPLDASALTTYISDVASTANAKGASLVGIEDTGAYYSGATAEAALADAGRRDAAPRCVTLRAPLSTVATSSVIARFTPGYSGTISKFTSSVETVVTTAAKAATLTPSIAGTPTTGGAVALTSANCATLGAKINGSTVTAANTFGPTDEITVVASSVTAFAEGAALFYLFMAPA